MNFKATRLLVPCGLEYMIYIVRMGFSSSNNILVKFNVFIWHIRQKYPMRGPRKMFAHKTFDR